MSKIAEQIAADFWAAQAEQFNIDHGITETAQARADQYGAIADAASAEAEGSNLMKSKEANERLATSARALQARQARLAKFSEIIQATRTEAQSRGVYD